MAAGPPIQGVLPWCPRRHLRPEDSRGHPSLPGDARAETRCHRGVAHLRQGGNPRAPLPSKAHQRRADRSPHQRGSADPRLPSREPYGTEVPFQIGGVRYVARIEEHYHPPGGPRKPWGYHGGVSLFLEYHIPENDLPLLDDAVDPAPEKSPTDEAPTIETTGFIVVDPGHGGSAMLGASSPNNATSPSGVKEKDLVLVMAELIRDIIITKQPQVQVELTRTTDVNVALFDRARLARDLNSVGPPVSAHAGS